MKLHHTVIGTLASEHAKSIEANGIIAQVADAYKLLVPWSIRHLPIIWLTEGYWQGGDLPIFEVDSKYLDQEKLHRVEFLVKEDKNLNWWVYQGNIPPNVLTRLT